MELKFYISIQYPHLRELLSMDRYKIRDRTAEMGIGQPLFILENWFIVRQTSLGLICLLPSITSSILRELGVQLGSGTYLSWVAIITFCAMCLLSFGEENELLS